MAIQSIQAAPTNAAKVQHETEKQRHHVRVQLPAIVVINDIKYTTEDISEGGFSVRAEENVFQKGDQDVKVYFPFHNFAFQLKLQTRPIYYSQSLRRAGFTFPHIDPRQLSLLNLVIKSSLTGEITSNGEIMDALKHPNAMPVGNYPHSKWSRIIPLSLIAVAGLAGLILLSGSIYENTSIVKSYTAVIEADTYSVRAHDSGIYNSLLATNATKVAKGQDIAVLKKSDGTDSGPATEMTIKSPCDCYVFKTFSKDGEFRTTGEPLFELLPLQPNAWVTASVRPDQSHSLRLQDDAYVQIAGENKFIDGHITAFLPPNFENDSSQVRIKTTQPLPAEAVGQPAYVEFVIF